MDEFQQIEADARAMADTQEIDLAAIEEAYAEATTQARKQREQEAQRMEIFEDSEEGEPW
jgi:hypothetical protein